MLNCRTLNVERWTFNERLLFRDRIQFFALRYRKDRATEPLRVSSNCTVSSEELLNRIATVQGICVTDLGRTPSALNSRSGLYEKLE
jgi:hypothetical protein